MSADTFTILAEPTRRRILQELISNERSVGELVASLEISQPAVSKHLRVLRESGFVSSRTAGQQRIYGLRQEPFVAVDEWLEPFRQMWERHLTALERHLDRIDPQEE